MTSTPAYTPQRIARSQTLRIRGLDSHCNVWGDATMASAAHPTLVLMHGWMDVGASFQFAVDALAAIEGEVRHIVAPDWRGFGASADSGADSYWFPDYLGDLDGLIDAFAPNVPVDLLGHSMGGNVVMGYAGARPQRVRRLVNLEGFGMPPTAADDAPQRLVRWLDELKKPLSLRDYDSVGAVAARLQKNNPRLAADKAAWLAPQWSRQRASGRWHILGDPAHMRTNPVPYRVDEHLALWRRISAPLLWVEADDSELPRSWGDRYSRADFHARLGVVADVRRETLSDSGHMLHHDQPQALAALLHDFLGS